MEGSGSPTCWKNSAILSVESCLYSQLALIGILTAADTENLLPRLLPNISARSIPSAEREGVVSIHHVSFIRRMRNHITN